MKFLFFLYANSKNSFFSIISFMYLYTLRYFIVKGETMVTAYITISTELGSEDDVKEAIESIEGVRECNVVYGVYDLVALIEADTTEKLNEMVFNKIRKFEGVKSTLTLIVVE